jgi:hypothetical protein
VTDELEKLRHELADVDAAAEGGGAGDDLLTHRACLEDTILSMERAAREEIGVHPARRSWSTRRTSCWTAPTRTR